ncbi:MAG: transporter [Syntrophobacteraceae bacterium]|nr:transporter [Syntrophobacteraceae bacterium]
MWNAENRHWSFPDFHRPCRYRPCGTPPRHDDTGTQGKGNFQIELNYEFTHEDSGGFKEDVHQIEPVLSYGIIDSVDFVVALPYQFISTREEGVKNREDGISDLSIEVKWRFYECEGFSLAAKPGISIPTGDDDEGLGAGRVGGSFFLIATQEIEPWAFHFNAGYGRNESTAEEERDIWHFSLASEFEAAPWLKLVANVGAERNTDLESDTPAVFALGGMIFPVLENLDLDVGVKAGLTRPEVEPTTHVAAGLGHERTG